MVRFRVEYTFLILFNLAISLKTKLNLFFSSLYQFETMYWQHRTRYKSWEIIWSQRGVKRNIRDIEITTSTTSDSLVTEKSSKVKITSDSVFKDFNNSQGFLPSQVTSPFSPPWPHGPHQCPLYPTFYHILVYWGCMVPFWYTLETSTCLGKRTRDEALHDKCFLC